MSKRRDAVQREKDKKRREKFRELGRSSTYAEKRKAQIRVACEEDEQPTTETDER